MLTAVLAGLLKCLPLLFLASICPFNSVMVVVPRRNIEQTGVLCLPELDCVIVPSRIT